MRNVLIAATLGLTLAAGPAPDSEDAQIMAGHEEWIRTQHLPGTGYWCCDISDGRPAEVRRRNGHWQVYYDREHWSDGTNLWIDVADNKVLPQQSPIYTPIAWIRSGNVFCIALSGAS